MCQSGVDKIFRPTDHSVWVTSERCRRPVERVEAVEDPAHADPPCAGASISIIARQRLVIALQFRCRSAGSTAPVLNARTGRHRPASLGSTPYAGPARAPGKSAALVDGRQVQVVLGALGHFCTTALSRRTAIWAGKITAAENRRLGRIAGAWLRKISTA